MEEWEGLTMARTLTLAVQGEHLPWQPEVNTYPGNPRWTLTLAVQGEHLPWQPRVNTYPGSPG